MVSCVVLLLAGLAVISANPQVKKFPKCDKTLIENIELYWKSAGIPKGVLELKGQYSAYKSTNAAILQDIKCRTYSFLPGNKVASTIDGVERNEDAKENDGVIAFAERKSYVILADGGVIATYTCSEDNDAPAFKPDDKEDATILLKKDADKDTLAHIEGVLSLLGFNLDKEYKCD